ncbi:hypothetical protein ADIS_3614 [Lunatimonas lonarensis]|uniref:Uncharacterized protein n=1 Tax=Lunatimonas lonarensis TaxID=1232681 RepID=R7ZPG9_9BACT|nr:hypothetical protein ADIS_3614 [Lunatimonas lonarensis]
MPTILFFGIYPSFSGELTDSLATKKIKNRQPMADYSFLL